MSDRLNIDKSLPQIEIPADKNELFFNWYDNDLVMQKELPLVFNRGYVFIDCSKLIHIKSKTIFEVKDDQELYKIAELKKKIHNDYDNIIVYFEVNNNAITLFGYTHTGSKLFRIVENTNTQFIHKIQSSALNSTWYKKILDLDMMTSHFSSVTEVKEYLNDFSRRISDVCLVLVISALWYLMTASNTEKYKVTLTDKKVVDKYKTTGGTAAYRTIKTPIYNLSDKRINTVEKLITRRNGWTISHSFQVRGHYRHYKSGKVVFIKPFIKCEDRGDFKPTKILVSPEEI